MSRSHRFSSSLFLFTISPSAHIFSFARAACTPKGGFLGIAPQEPLLAPGPLTSWPCPGIATGHTSDGCRPAWGLGPVGVEHQGKQERKARPHERTSRGNKHALQQVIRYLMQRTSFFLMPSGATLTCYRNKRKKGALSAASPSICTRNQGGTHG